MALTSTVGFAATVHNALSGTPVDDLATSSMSSSVHGGGGGGRTVALTAAQHTNVHLTRSSGQRPGTGGPKSLDDYLSALQPDGTGAFTDICRRVDVGKIAKDLVNSPSMRLSPRDLEFWVDYVEDEHILVMFKDVCWWVYVTLMNEQSDGSLLVPGSDVAVMHKFVFDRTSDTYAQVMLHLVDDPAKEARYRQFQRLLLQVNGELFQKLFPLSIPDAGSPLLHRVGILTKRLLTGCLPAASQPRTQEKRLAPATLKSKLSLLQTGAESSRLPSVLSQPQLDHTELPPAVHAPRTRTAETLLYSPLIMHHLSLVDSGLQHATKHAVRIRLTHDASFTELDQLQPPTASIETGVCDSLTFSPCTVSRAPQLSWSSFERRVVPSFTMPALRAPDATPPPVIAEHDAERKVRIQAERQAALSPVRKRLTMSASISAVAHRHQPSNAPPPVPGVKDQLKRSQTTAKSIMKEYQKQRRQAMKSVLDSRLNLISQEQQLSDIRKQVLNKSSSVSIISNQLTASRTIFEANSTTNKKAFDENPTGGVVPSSTTNEAVQGLIQAAASASAVQLPVVQQLSSNSSVTGGASGRRRSLRRSSTSSNPSQDEPDYSKVSIKWVTPTTVHDRSQAILTKHTKVEKIADLLRGEEVVLPDDEAQPAPQS